MEMSSGTGLRRSLGSRAPRTLDAGRVGNDRPEGLKQSQWYKRDMCNLHLCVGVCYVIEHIRHRLPRFGRIYDFRAKDIFGVC